jgi:superfamily II DNA or RNA helicase
MMKSYINKRGYVIIKEHYDAQTLNELRNDLNVKPFNNFADTVESYKVYEENNKKMYLPKIYALNKLGQPDQKKVPEGDDINLEFCGEIRENQQIAIDSSLTSLRTTGGGLLVLPCGYGKTCIGLYLISKIKKKTLVICHKEFLVEQWRERISVFLPDARIGIIQGQKFDIEDKDIVIGMLQSLSMKEYELNAFDSINFLIIDECHHISSKVFSKALRRLNCDYHIGLSATPKRADGLMKVLHWHIGDIFFSVSAKEDNKQKRDVSVKRYILNSTNHVHYKELLNYKQRPNVVGMISNIISFEKRNCLIVEKILELTRDKRNILVLSERRGHLSLISELLTVNNYDDWGFYVGGMKIADLKMAENRQVILGTYQMCSEGYDNSNLDTLIMTTSKGDVEQSVGRILRKKIDIIEPLVVDFVDNFSAFSNQGKKRETFYKKKQYKVKNEILVI